MEVAYLKDGSSTLHILGLILLISTISLLFRQLTSSHDRREPPIIVAKVPLIGHLLGLIKHDAEYLSILIFQNPLPIFTLKIFSFRIHVINSPELHQAVFRNAKTISMDQVSIGASQRIFGASKEGMKILKYNSPGLKGNTFMKTMDEVMHNSMSPSQGKGLFEMNARALNGFTSFLSDIDNSEKSVVLYSWLVDCFTIASAEALYGPINPVSENKSLIQGLQDFEASIGLLFLNIIPSFIAPKAHRARRAFGSAFMSYYNRKLNRNASVLIQGRYRELRAGGFELEDIRKFDIGILMAATMNSGAGIFWLICYLFSNAILLSEIRAEISTIITLTRDNKGKKEICFDVSSLQTQCPLLVSAWQETLRLKDAVISTRVVEEDTVLNDTYLLKKGSLVQIPSSSSNMSPSIWGPDARIFNARRFMKAKTDKIDREQARMQKLAFHPFGGGSSLCPGRHFATTEILGVAATIVLGYELRMADGTGLRVPKAKKQLMSVAVLQPADELDIVMERRQDFKGVRWSYDVGGDVVEEDMVF